MQQHKFGIIAIALLALTGCGGGHDTTTASTAQTSVDGIKRTAAVTAAANMLVVRAKAQLAGTKDGPADYKQGAFMTVFADGQAVDAVQVMATSYQDYSFTLPTTAAGTKIDVMFSNDLDTKPGQDRNLFVESITANGKTIASTDADVRFDRATADLRTAFDGQDVMAGTDSLWWNGALRFTLGGNSTVSSSLSPACAALYAANPSFVLNADRAVTNAPVLPKPSKGAALAEPNFKTCLTRATDHTADGLVNDNGQPVANARTEYSRRQMFNADNTRQLVLTSDGFFYLYDANSHAKVKKLPSFGEDPEIQWHPTNPDLIYVMPNRGGEVKQKEMNVVTGTERVVGDFAARLTALFPGATPTNVYTKAEGSPSADGRYWCYLVRDAAHPDSGGSWGSVGVFTWDRDTDTIVGSMPLNGEIPDHVSMSPTGNYCVVSSDGAIGTTAYSRDFKQSKKLIANSVHSDLALDANGDDVFVYIDSTDYGDVYMTNLRTGIKTLLMGGIRTDAHFSGKAFSKPGWVAVTTLDKWTDSAGPQWMQKKVMAVELKANPTVYNLAFHRVNYTDYDTSPLASVNRDFTRIAFNSNWGNGSTPGDIDTYNIEIPAGTLKTITSGSTAPPTPVIVTPPTTTAPPPPSPAASVLTVSVGNVTHAGYSASYVLTTNQAASCRATWTAGRSYAEIYDDIPRSANGLTHTKALALPGTGPQSVYAACKATASGAESLVTINLP
jgi:hypothetical protein